MKKSILLVVLIVVGLYSCKKEGSVAEVRSKLRGTWEIKSTNCGICPIPVTNYPVGNGNTITFFTNGGFERKKQDTLITIGSYIVAKDKECNTPDNRALTIKEGSRTTIFFIDVDNNELTLSTPSCYADGAVTSYRKVQ